VPGKYLIYLWFNIPHARMNRHSTTRLSRSGYTASKSFHFNFHRGFHPHDLSPHVTAVLNGL